MANRTAEMPTVMLRCTNGRANRDAIVAGEPLHDRVLPLLGALAGTAMLAITGATTMAKTSAPSSAKVTVQAMGLKSRPSTACRVKMGR